MLRYILRPVDILLSTRAPVCALRCKSGKQSALTSTMAQTPPPGYATTNTKKLLGLLRISGNCIRKTCGSTTSAHCPAKPYTAQRPNSKVAVGYFFHMPMRPAYDCRRIIAHSSPRDQHHQDIGLVYARHHPALIGLLHLSQRYCNDQTLQRN